MSVADVVELEAARTIVCSKRSSCGQRGSGSNTGTGPLGFQGPWHWH